MAAPETILKPLDVFDLEWVADPQIAPDGRSIAFVRMSMDIKTDKPRAGLWLINADGSGELPICAGDVSGSSPALVAGWDTRIAYVGSAR